MEEFSLFLKKLFVPFKMKMGKAKVRTSSDDSFQRSKNKEHENRITEFGWAGRASN